MRPIDRVIDAMDGVINRGGDQYMARCPAHDDGTASLTIADGDDGRVLLRCWAGCSANEVVVAVGMTLADLFPPRSRAERQRYRREKRTLGNYDTLAYCLLVVMLDCGVGPMDRPVDARPRHPGRSEYAVKHAKMAVDLIRGIYGIPARHPGRALTMGEGRELLYEVAGMRGVIIHRLNWLRGGISVYDGDVEAYRWRCHDRARGMRADDREMAAATRVAVGLLAVYGS